MSVPEDPDALILSAFLESGEKYVSGEFLAARLGVSRVSIWNRMKKLEEDGFRFHAVRNRGYQLQQEPEGLYPALLRAHGHHQRLPWPLHAFASIDSTSSEVERRLIEGEPAPFAVIASAQTLGRGRLGRTWTSPNCGNLYLSLALRPEMPPARMQTFTLWFGVKVARALAALTGLPMAIKWPNDLICRGRKIAGMLTEARVDNDRLKDLVFGLGLNLNAQSHHFPEPLRDKASSLALEAGRTFPLHRLAIQILKVLDDAWQSMEEGDVTPELLRQWPALDCLEGKTVQLAEGNRLLAGVARGIDAQGSLLLETEEGTLQRIRSGDVSLQGAYAPTENEVPTK